MFGSRRKAHKRKKNQRRELMIPSAQGDFRPRKQLRNKGLKLKEYLKGISILQQYLHISALGIAILLLMGGFIAFAFASPYFELKRIEVERESARFDPGQVEAALSEIKGKNLLFLQKSDVETILFERFPTFRSIEMEELWPDGIRISVEISQPSFLLENTFDAITSVMTEDGVAIRRYADESLPRWKILQHERPIQPSTQVLSPDEVQFIRDAQTGLLKGFGIITDEVQILWAARELHLVADGRMTLWFDLNIPLIDQLERLAASAQEIELSTRGFKHIDLRIPEHLYFEWN